MRSFQAERPRPLFQTAGLQVVTSESSYSVSADGQRFLIGAPSGDQPASPQLDVLVNWEAALLGTLK